MRRRLLRLGLLACCGVLACAPAARAAETWLEARSPNFRVVTTGNVKDAREVAANFERLRAVLRQTTRVSTRTDIPLTIIAVTSGKQLRALLRTSREEVAGAFVPGPDAQIALVRLDLERETRYKVAYHEYLHVIVRQSIGAAPLWLNEGIAELYGHARLDSDKIFVGVPAPYHLAILQDQTPLPLETLLAVDRSSPHYNESHRVSIFYAQSWALTHFLMLGDKGAHRPKLFAFMDAANRGLSVRDAAAKAFGNVPEFERQFRDYIRRFQFPALSDTLPVDDSMRQLQVQPLTTGQALSLQATLSALLGKDDAQALATQALTAEPALPEAWVAQARVARRGGHSDEARTALAKAIELGSTDPLVHFGWAELETARLATDAPLDRVAAALERALSIDGQLTRALALLAHVRARQDRNPNRAFDLIKKAIELEPGNSQHFVTLAGVLHTTRDRTLVAQALERAELLARTEPERASVARARQSLVLP